jgi:hypothetical protein
MSSYRYARSFGSLGFLSLFSVTSQDLLTEAEALRMEGNTLYKSGKEIDFEAAVDTYRRALAVLPDTTIGREREAARKTEKSDPPAADAGVSTADVPVMAQSGIVELTDEQAASLEREETRKREEEARRQQPKQDEELRRQGDPIREIETKIEEIRGFLYGNISAAFVALNKDSEAVEATQCEYRDTPPRHS